MNVEHDGTLSQKIIYCEWLRTTWINCDTISYMMTSDQIV